MVADRPDILSALNQGAHLGAPLQKSFATDGFIERLDPEPGHIKFLASTLMKCE